MACPYPLQHATRCCVDTNDMPQQVRHLGLSDSGDAERSVRANGLLSLNEKSEGGNPPLELIDLSNATDKVQGGIPLPAAMPSSSPGQAPSGLTGTVTPGENQESVAGVRRSRATVNPGTTLGDDTSHHSIRSEERSETVWLCPYSYYGRDYRPYTGDAGYVSFAISCSHYGSVHEHCTWDRGDRLKTWRARPDRDFACPIR